MMIASSHLLHVKRAHAELEDEIEGLNEEILASKRELETKARPKSRREVEQKVMRSRCYATTIATATVHCHHQCRPPLPPPFYDRPSADISTMYSNDPLTSLLYRLSSSNGNE